MVDLAESGGNLLDGKPELSWCLPSGGILSIALTTIETFKLKNYRDTKTIRLHLTSIRSNLRFLTSDYLYRPHNQDE